MSTIEVSSPAVMIWDNTARIWDLSKIESEPALVAKSLPIGSEWSLDGHGQ